MSGFDCLKIALICFHFALISCSHDQELCSQQFKLISASDSLKTFPLKDYPSSEQLVGNMVMKGKPEGFTYFGLGVKYPTDSILVLTRLVSPFLGDGHRTLGFRIHINEHEKILYQGEVINRHEIDSLFRPYYLNHGYNPVLPDSPEDAYVEIKWEEGSDLEFINDVFSSIIDAYYALLDKNICELEDSDIVSLKQTYPLVFEFRKNSSPPINSLEETLENIN